MNTFNEETSFQLKENDIATFKQKALYWANLFSTFCLLDNNQYAHYAYSNFEFCLAVDAIDFFQSETFDGLENFKQGKNVFGYLAYDLKNDVEKLQSNNEDNLQMPLLYFFEPRYLIKIKDNQLIINRNYPEAFHIFDSINQINLPKKYTKQNLHFKTNVAKADYLQNVKKIQDYIYKGDVYEMNYCIEYFAEKVSIDELAVFNQLNTIAKAPFSCFLKFDKFCVLSFSPERFLQKKGKKLISQPIKGTIKKGKTAVENQQLQKQLQNDIKERAENVMIVDLVRNDLSKSAKYGTIKVEELFSIYSFETINQMISTISAEMNAHTNTSQAIKNAFPMGSMTGAPKVRAMQIIEALEQQKRGVYSGAIGYFTKENDFDFNVVIRSLIYEKVKKYLSLQVGGAITYDSIPEKEWQETKTKVQAILRNI